MKVYKELQKFDAAMVRLAELSNSIPKAEKNKTEHQKELNELNDLSQWDEFQENRQKSLTEQLRKLQVNKAERDYLEVVKNNEPQRLRNLRRKVGTFNNVDVLKKEVGAIKNLDSRLSSTMRDIVLDLYDKYLAKEATKVTPKLGGLPSN